MRPDDTIPSKYIVAIDPGTRTWGYAIYHLDTESDTYVLTYFGQLKAKAPKGEQNTFVHRIPGMISSLRELLHGFIPGAMVVLEEPPFMWAGGRTAKAGAAAWLAFGVFFAVLYEMGYKIVAVKAQGFSKGSAGDGDAAVKLGKYYIEGTLHKRVKI